MRTKFLIIILLFATLSNSFCQSIQPMISMPSPNAASLGQYGEANVSLFTGTANINIPIYEINEGNIKVPISLSYLANGVRPDQHPGWVGMNWSLNAGGMITRIVKGAPDELYWKEEILAFIDNSQWEGNYQIGINYHLDQLAGSDWNSSAKVDVLAKNTSWYETEPDEFIFNFGGYSGKFYINQDKYAVVSDPSIRVEVEDTMMLIQYPSYIINNYIGGAGASFDEYEYKIRGFRITTPDGTAYEFGLWNRPQTANQPIEFSLDFFQQFDFNDIWDSWYLASIKSPEGRRVDFQYTAGDPIASFGQTTAMNKMQYSETPSGILGILGPVSASSFNITTRYTGKIIFPVYLSKITTSAQEITFSTSNTSELTYVYPSINIDLFSQSKETYRSDVFNYFVSNNNIYSWRWFYSPRVMIHPTNLQPWNINVSDFNTQFTLGGAGYYYNNGIGYFERQDIPLVNYPQSRECELIDFNKLQWKQLNRIAITNKLDQQLLKAFNFQYSSNTNDRLSLLKCYEESNNGQANPAYTFEYENYDNPYTAEGISHQQAGNTQQLPGYLSNKVDHWGFSNGTQAIVDFNNLSNYYAYRNPNKDYGYAGILNKITYPTGGYTKYFYEPHTYKAIVKRDANGNFYLASSSIPSYAGGLRIAQILNFNYDNTVLAEKDYQYGDGGVLVGDHQYYWPNYSGKYITGQTYTADRFVTQSILPVSSNGTGSHIGYSKVTELEPGKGEKDYYFSNFSPDGNPLTWDIKDDNFEVTIDPQKSIYAPFGNKDIERGKLKTTSVYASNGVHVKNEDNTFTPADNSAFVKAVATKQFQILDGTAVEGTAYKVYTYPNNLSTKTITDYDVNGQNPISTSITNLYNNYNQLASKTQTLNYGMTIETGYTYPTDVSLAAYQIPDVWAIINPIAAAYNTINALCPSSPPSTRATCMSAKWDQAGYPTECLDGNYNFNQQGCYDHYNHLPTADAEASAILDMIGKNIISKPIQIVEKKNGNIIGADYSKFLTQNNLTLPSTTYSVEISSPISSLQTPVTPYISSTGLFVKSPSFNSTNEQTYFDTYDNTGNILQFHKKNDSPASYLWGYNNSLPVAEIKNASSDKVAYTSFNSLGEGNWNYSSGTITPSTTAKTGASYFSFTGTNVINKVLSIGNYILEYWAKAAISVSGGTITDISTSAPDLNGWILYRKSVVISTSTTLSFTMTSGTAYIDELRLYPADAQMTTYTYNPLIGPTSKTDENNITTYYEYDVFGRLNKILDQDRKVLKQYEYHYQGQ